MPQINNYSPIYKLGFYLILCLPVLALPPYFFQPDWAKSIIFRSVVTILLFLFLCRQNVSFSWLFDLFKKNYIFWGITGTLSIFFVATIFSTDRLFSIWGSPYRGTNFITYAFLFIFAILVFLVLKKDEYKKIFIVSIFAGLAVAIIALIQFYEIPNPIFSPTLRPSATIGNPITLGIYLSILFFISLSLLFLEKSKIWKIFYSISLLIFFHGILITVSRAAFLGVATGMVIFILSFPKKNRALKISLIIFLILVFGILAYVNLIGKFPDIFSRNKLFSLMEPRLSFSKMIEDERFQAWKTFSLAIADRPLIGWGPENQTIGFDKFYDPKVTLSPWWDRAHNIFLDVGVQAGMLGLFSYLFLLSSVFWALRKAKIDAQIHEEKILITGIQAALVAFLVAGFFSLDSMPSHILIFFIIAYALNLSNSTDLKPKIENLKQTSYSIIKNISLGFSFLVLMLFLWQYNFFPLIENGKMNIAEALAKNKRCDDAFVLMDEVLEKHSFLDAYSAIQYVDLTITCNTFYPEKNMEYIKKGFEVVKNGVPKRPFYTRFWISLGSYANTLAEKEQDENKKNTLLIQAGEYLNQAEKISPNHPEILIGKMRSDIISKNYRNMAENAEKCTFLAPSIGYCHFYLGLSKIYNGFSEEGKKEIQIAGKNNYSVKAKQNLDMQADAFEAIKDYTNLIEIYEDYIKLDYKNPQYHSSLAYVYSLIGKYKEAREEALIVMELSPQAEGNVKEFLQTLPWQYR